MDDSDRADLDRMPPRARNGALRALWVFSSVVLIAGVACAAVTVSAYSTTYGVNTEPIDYAIINVLSMITSPLMTAGLAGVGLALAVQALAQRGGGVSVAPDARPFAEDAQADRDDAQGQMQEQEGDHRHPDKHERDGLPVGATPAVASSPVTDHERFMRPERRAGIRST